MENFTVVVVFSAPDLAVSTVRVARLRFSDTVIVTLAPGAIAGIVQLRLFEPGVQPLTIFSSRTFFDDLIENGTIVAAALPVFVILKLRRELERGFAFEATRRRTRFANFATKHAPYVVASVGQASWVSSP